MALRFRPATVEDTAFFRELHHRAYREVVTRQFGVWDLVAQDRWFEEGLAESVFTVVEHAGQPIGALGLKEGEDGWFLAELQILPELQGRGFGSAVLKTVLDRAERAQKSVALRVLNENRARTLYERHGFATTGQTETHYLMQWRPPSP